MSPLQPDAIAARARAAFPGTESRLTENGQPFLLVRADDLPGLARLLRDDRELAFDAVMDLTGCDLLQYPATPPTDAIAVVYLLFSYVHRHKVTLRVLAPRAACTVPTVSDVWPAAIYFEREVWDLLGVQFQSHPSLHRIMCPEDWSGHGLRKDYVYPQDYHGVPHLRDGQKFEYATSRPGTPATAAPAEGGAKP